MSSTDSSPAAQWGVFAATAEFYRSLYQLQVAQMTRLMEHYGDWLRAVGAHPALTDYHSYVLDSVIRAPGAAALASATRGLSSANSVEAAYGEIPQSPAR